MTSSQGLGRGHPSAPSAESLRLEAAHRSCSDRDRCRRGDRGRHSLSRHRRLDRAGASLRRRRTRWRRASRRRAEPLLSRRFHNHRRPTDRRRRDGRQFRHGALADEPGSPPAAALAAEAALALHARLAGDGISQRIMVTAGRLTVVTLELSGDRRILLLSGPPIRALNSAAANCPPGGVALPPGVEPVAAKGEASPSQNCSNCELAPFLPRPIVDRIVAGHRSWLAEFRDLTAIMLRLDGMEAETEGGAPLAAAVRAVDAAFHGVGLGVAEVAEGDKGTLLRVAVGDTSVRPRQQRSRRRRGRATGFGGAR